MLASALSAATLRGFCGLRFQCSKAKPQSPQRNAAEIAEKKGSR
jgi:hypothetical protein